MCTEQVQTFLIPQTIQCNNYLQCISIGFKVCRRMYLGYMQILCHLYEGLEHLRIWVSTGVLEPMLNGY
jgi:hypothetical protein